MAIAQGTMMSRNQGSQAAPPTTAPTMSHVKSKTALDPAQMAHWPIWRGVTGPPW
jgi:hypothetical protein